MMELHNSSSGGGTSDSKTETQRAASPVSSCVSMSDRSMQERPVFSSGFTPSNPGTETKRAASSVTSCVSMKSDESMEETPAFSSGSTPSYPGTEPQRAASPVPSSMDKPLHSRPWRHFKEVSQAKMKTKFESLYEGIKTLQNKTLLNTVYTQLYITEGESEGVNEEHEVLKMEKRPRKHMRDTPINCSDIFKHVQNPEQEKEDEKVRVVLTKGISGIGKTVSVQKFILDWAEGKTNQDVDFMFVLSFRELNLIKDDQTSFYKLLCDMYPDMKDLDPEKIDTCKVVFIFDGLDESRITLNFSQSEKVSNITMTSSVSVLMTNLIKGELLPSALIWITSRPAAANQIPPQYINRVTEIQGFNDPQKEEYFRKRISDKDQAEKIISHIKTAKSLHIMCHIPVFCWISATVLQEIMKQKEIPKTLTDMYLHFLFIQTNMMDEKYEMKSEKYLKNLPESHRSLFLKLAKLAFKQLIKGNIVFCEKDLRECEIDVTEASVYSGICSEIFREESVLHQRKVYCFVHLSFQEFLAALYLFHCFVNKTLEDVKSCIPPHWEKYMRCSPSDWSQDDTLHELLACAVDKAVKSRNGHLDLFLRFLLGISLESNQRFLYELSLLPYRVGSQDSNDMTVEYIKKQIKTEDLPTERSINLFLCLTEMRDKSLSREIQEYLKSEKQSEKWLSAAHCSAIAYMLQMSEEVLDKLELKKFNTSEEGYRRLLPLIANCRKALLGGCNLTTKLSETICSALKSENSHLKELDLSNNDFQDSGVEKLSDGLMNCKLEILRLASCNLTQVCSEPLRSALKSKHSQLRELDLSHNDFQDLGVEKLSVGLKNLHCKLETLRLANCNLTKKSSKTLYSVLTSDNTLQDLDISNNDLQDSGVEQLSSALKDSHCKLNTLRWAVCKFIPELKKVMP